MTSPDDLDTSPNHDLPEPMSSAEEFAILVGQIVAPLRDEIRELRADVQRALASAEELQELRRRVEQIEQLEQLDLNGASP